VSATQIQDLYSKSTIEINARTVQLIELTLDAAAEAGISAVIQPGGSMRDDEVIAAADEHNIAMVFTGMRHFRH